MAALGEAPYAFASTVERERDNSPEQWRERLRRNAWFVACVDDQPAGLVAGTTWPDEDPDRRHLISMWVRPSYRGLGIAAQLIAAVRDWAADAGAHELELWVADGNEAALRTYAGAGFVPSGRRQPLPSNPAVGEEMWVLAMTTAERAQPHEAVENPG